MLKSIISLSLVFLMSGCFEHSFPNNPSSRVNGPYAIVNIQNQSFISYRGYDSTVPVQMYEINEEGDLATSKNIQEIKIGIISQNDNFTEFCINNYIWVKFDTFDSTAPIQIFDNDYPMPCELREKS